MFEVFRVPNLHKKEPLWWVLGVRCTPRQVFSKINRIRRSKITFRHLRYHEFISRKIRNNSE